MEFLDYLINIFIIAGDPPKKACGRPLGLRLSKETNELYIADAYSGIFKLDLGTGIIT